MFVHWGGLYTLRYRPLPTDRPLKDSPDPVIDSQLTFPPYYGLKIPYRLLGTIYITVSSCQILFKTQISFLS